MKEEEDKLIKGFRDRLKDYSEPVPTELWDSLEKELSPVAVSSVHPFRRLAVAAAIVFVVVSSVSLWYLLAPIDTYVADIPAVQLENSLKPVEPLKPHAEPVLVEKAKAQTLQAKRNNVEPDRSKIDSLEEKETESQSDIEEENHLPVTEEVQEQGNEPEAAPRSYTGAYRKIQAVAKKNKTMDKWSASISVTNGTVDAKTVNPGFNVFSVGNASEQLSMDAPIGIPNAPLGENDRGSAGAQHNVVYNNIRKEVITDVKHKMPVTFGASFRYHLSKSFALETGLIYTILSSELRSGSKADYWIQQQKLHYLGIPLKANWTFLDMKYLTLYLSGGGTVEKAISGKLSTDYFVVGEKKSGESESLTVDPVQWSVGASVGVQFNATKHLGIYVEPGIIHYFDDGSAVETIRKEKPTNFNLQMGLRLTY